MIQQNQELKAAYDAYYRQPNYFHYRTWLYQPFIRALIRKAQLEKGYKVLDVGCGQGFFSSLFANEGLNTLGIDLSTEGIASATRNYHQEGLNFEVADIRAFSGSNAFDCVYVRSCSLYNINDFENNRETTNILLQFVRPGGVLIFDYYSNLCKRKAGGEWRYHSTAAVENHFAPYPATDIFFSARLAPIILGRFAFSKCVSSLDSQLSKYGGVGGELIAIVRKTT